MSLTIELSELPARLDEVLKVAGGAEVIVTENSVPRARLIPYASGGRRTPDLHPGPIETTIVNDEMANGIQFLSATTQYALAVENLPFHHKDPFDRMLIAQAVMEGATIATADSKFSPYAVPLLW